MFVNKRDGGLNRARIGVQKLLWLVGLGDPTLLSYMFICVQGFAEGLLKLWGKSLETCLSWGPRHQMGVRTIGSPERTPPGEQEEAQNQC